MVSVVKRMSKLRALLDLRFGPGAATLPDNISRLELSFARKWNNGHLGPRKFWRECLPRLKYHNPAISMIVKRTDDNQAAPSLTVIFQEDDCVDNNNPENAQSQIIDVRDLSHSQILSRLYEFTKAQTITPSLQESKIQREVVESRAAQDKDIALSLAERARRKRDAVLLAQARGQAS